MTFPHPLQTHAAALTLCVSVTAKPSGVAGSQTRNPIMETETQITQPVGASDFEGAIGVFQDIILDVSDGETSALDAYAVIHRAEKAIKELKDAVKDQALSEAKDRDDGTLEAFGYRVETASRRTYIYKEDEAWLGISKQRKERQSLLQQAARLAEKGTELTDTETGEIVVPPGVKHTEYIKLTDTL